MTKDTVTVQNVKIEVKLYVDTEPEDFKDWLGEHLPSGWDTDPYGPRFPTGDGGYCILEPAKVERTNERNYNVKVPGTCWTESIWTEQGPVRRSESYASVVTEMIWFKITRLAPGRVEVVARCEHLAVRDYFRKKLEEIAEAYPEAREQVAKQLGVEEIPMPAQEAAALSADLQAIKAKRCRSLLQQLAVQRSNLNELELQRARFGIRVPLDLINEIKMVQQHIEQIERELAQKGLGDRSARATADELERTEGLSIDSGGGTVIVGDVHVGRDFVGRDGNILSDVHEDEDNGSE